MNAVIVCVDFGDLLAITLPRNRHHFDKVLVVTSFEDTETQEVAKECKAITWNTDTFWANGELFNKFAALEEALDYMHFRKGWLAFLDADVIWPTTLPFGKFEMLKPGFLYSPYRRIWSEVQEPPVEEQYWSKLRQYVDFEFAGYTQIFHAEDEHLPQPPWHPTDWIHAGGGDSEFQFLWPESHKVRPLWEVLHLGQPGMNWTGRATRRVDGSMPEDWQARRQRLIGLMQERNRSGGYSHERLGGREGIRRLKAPSRPQGRS
jgi:hypothetical protein